MAKIYFHGTRAELKKGDLVMPDVPLEISGQDGFVTCVCLTSNPDEAIWEAELSAASGPARVYTVEPTGSTGNAADLKQPRSVRHPLMSFWSREPLRVTGEVTEWPLYHGTRADLRPGDMIGPGYTPNFGNRSRKTTWVYLSRTLDAAAWGAELATGDGQGRIYAVEPTGPVEDDPNLTDKKFRGNPTKSFRSREPLRVTGEVTEWQGHSPEAVKAMKEGLERLAQLGVEPLDD